MEDEKATGVVLNNKKSVATLRVVSLLYCNHATHIANSEATLRAVSSLPLSSYSFFCVLHSFSPSDTVIVMHSFTTIATALTVAGAGIVAGRAVQAPTAVVTPAPTVLEHELIKRQDPDA